MLPRSFLYVPANRRDLFTKAAHGNADAIVLDLEDAVPMTEKPMARLAVHDWLSARAASPDAVPGVEVWARVNDTRLLEDLPAVVGPALSGLFLATCTPAVLQQASEILDTLEARCSLTPGTTRVVGLIESAEGLLSLATMAAQPRLHAFGIGEVDLLGDLRIARTSHSAAAVTALRTTIVVHSAAAGLEAPVAPTSTDFRDLDAFAESTQAMLDLGFRSRTAIHPVQVPVIHRTFAPTPEETAAAQDVINRFEAAAGGVTTDSGGRLIDAAVVRAAHEVVSRSRD